MTVRTLYRGSSMLHALEVYALLCVISYTWLLVEAARAPLLEWHD